MASEVKEETNSKPTEAKNDVDEKVKDEDSKPKDSVKDEPKGESGKTASTEDSKTKTKKEEEEDDDDEEDDEEEEVGLLDRPVEVTGCRARKKVERLIVSFSTPKEKQELPEGKGKKLGDCAKIEFQIQKSKVQDLKPLHRILFNRIGSVNEIKKNIRKFSGFPFEQDSVEFNRKKASLEKVTLSVLKQVCSVLDIERGGTKGEITNRIMNFLLKPEDSGKKVPSAKKKASKDEKKSTKKGKSEKKSKADKNENSADESEKSDDDDDSTGGDASMGGTDEENEPEIESDEEPKKKSKDTKPAKGKSKADKVKKDEKKSKGSKRKADEDSDASSADEPVAKKSKMPTDDEISKLVKQILESADLQEITMKKVIKQVSDAYPDFDLSHKKAFIKQTIKSVIS